MNRNEFYAKLNLLIIEAKKSDMKTADMLEEIDLVLRRQLAMSLRR